VCKAKRDVRRKKRKNRLSREVKNTKKIYSFSSFAV
jgi:hypothetical protein